MNTDLHISDTEALAAKKHAGAKLRKLGLGNDLRDFEPHTLEWGDLQSRKKEFVNLAKDLAGKISDDLPEDEARSLEKAYDGIMHLVDACEGEMDQRSVIGDRAPRVHGGDPRRPMGANIEGNGGEARAIPEHESRILTPEQRMVDVVRSHERGGVDLGRYLRAMVVGGQSEAERRALTEGSDSAGGYTVPERLSAQLIDLMRARTVAIRAGAGTVPLTSDKNHIAKLASDPVPAWRAESGQVNESDPTFTRVTFEPKSLAVLVKVSRELLEDSLNLGTDLPRVLAAALAGELDRVVFLGVNGHLF